MLTSMLRDPSADRIERVQHLGRQERGFTLIELMVTVAIVAILAAIAYPNYRNYVLRGQIVSATNGLAEMRANMERFYQDNRDYRTVSSGGTTFLTPCSTPVQYGTFLVQCNTSVPPTLTTFSLQAVGSNSTSGFAYYVTNTNLQTTIIAAPAPASWIAGSPYNCWATKVGAC